MFLRAYFRFLTDLNMNQTRSKFVTFKKKGSHFFRNWWYELIWINAFSEVSLKYIVWRSSGLDYWGKTTILEHVFTASSFFHAAACFSSDRTITRAPTLHVNRSSLNSKFVHSKVNAKVCIWGCTPSPSPPLRLFNLGKVDIFKEKYQKVLLDQISSWF